MEVGKCYPLEYAKYRFWYEAITSDNIDLISRTLQESDSKGQEELLNGVFDLDLIASKVQHKQEHKASSPIVWHMVATLCSEKTIKLFLSHGTNIFSQTDLGYNFVHTMVITAAVRPESEDRILHSYKVIMECITSADKIRLLSAENEDGMRPLDFAMHNATTGLFQGICHLIIDWKALFCEAFFLVLITKSVIYLCSDL